MDQSPIVLFLNSDLALRSPQLKSQVKRNTQSLTHLRLPRPLQSLGTGWNSMGFMGSTASPLPKRPKPVLSRHQSHARSLEFQVHFPSNNLQPTNLKSVHETLLKQPRIPQSLRSTTSSPKWTLKISKPLSWARHDLLRASTTTSPLARTLKLSSTST